jgi:Glycosyltransferases involved in cell wall biogenesis
MDIKLSVIIPVYNAGKYLNCCIHHLQKQTLKDIEFLFIIDKPTDGSDKVVKGFCDERSKICCDRK